MGWALGREVTLSANDHILHETLKETIMSCSRNQDIVDVNFQPAAQEKPFNLNRLANDRAGKLPQISTALNWMSQAVKLVDVWRERTRARRALLRLNDHLLKDIGISRLDANIESTKSFWQQ